MKITLNVTDRKPLINLISNFTGEPAVYMRTPTYAYRIGGYTVTREGNIETPENLDFAVIHAFYEALAHGGYYPKEAEPTPIIAEEEEIMGESIVSGENTEVSENTEAVEVTDENISTNENQEIPEQVVTVDKTPPRTSDPVIPENPSLSAETINRLNSLRSSLIREINRQFNEIISTGGVETPRRSIPSVRENIGPAMVTEEGSVCITLYGDISTLRGTKPTLVRYGEEAIPVTSWKRAFAAVLDICNRQERCHEALLAARNETMGRSRKVMADSPQGMLSPLKIDDGLYVETNFSTEALLRLLRDRILNRIGFDASSITFEYWRP